MLISNAVGSTIAADGGCAGWADVVALLGTFCGRGGRDLTEFVFVN